MASVQQIMENAEATGANPDDELRQLVERTVLQGVVTGYDMTVDTSQRRGDDDVGEQGELHPSKRSRTDDGPQ